MANWTSAPLYGKNKGKKLYQAWFKRHWEAPKYPGTHCAPVKFHTHTSTRTHSSTVTSFAEKLFGPRMSGAGQLFRDQQATLCFLPAILPNLTAIYSGALKKSSQLKCFIPARNSFALLILNTAAVQHAAVSPNNFVVVPSVWESLHRKLNRKTVRLFLLKHTQLILFQSAHN